VSVYIECQSASDFNQRVISLCFVFLICFIGADVCLVTALHGMHTWSSNEDSVCLSVCPSVKRVICDRMKESCAHILIPHERLFTLVL